MWNSRRICGIGFVAGVLVALLGIPAAFAQEKTPPRGPPPDDPASVTRSLQAYNAVDDELRRAGVLEANPLAAHWRKLRDIRVRLEQLETRGQLDRDTPMLKKEVVRLLESSALVNIGGNGPAENRLRRAQENRLSDLVALARLANRRFGTNIRVILGVQVEAGVG